MFLDEVDYPQQEMFTAEGEKWRRLRNIVTPSFTARRMKQVDNNPLFFKFKFHVIKRMYSWKLNKENKCLVMNIHGCCLAFL